MLWTIQNREFYDTLSKEGIIYTDGRKIIPYFRKAYKWMVEQMNERGVPTVKYPIWAWHMYEKGKKKPDLRRKHGARGENMVLIEFDPPKELVLLSDFIGWHSVLNGGYHSCSEAEDNKYGDTKSQKLKEKSWLKIFDMTDEGRDEDWIGKLESIQACLPYLDSEWVVAVKEFSSR